jgi:hydroxymethylbilane synthase
MAAMTEHADIFKTSPMRLASRASQLAMAQAQMVCAALAPTAVTVRPVTTSGDRILDRPLIEAGGKGLFIKELERSLLAGEADLAVHSMKDMEAHFAPHTEIGAVLAREDRRDALIGDYQSIDDLPESAVVGTASVRRAAILLHHRPDLEIKLIRGNINRRLSLLANGEFDAIVLAVAGIKRLGLDVPFSPIDPAIMPSAVAQGALAVQIRAPFDDRSEAVKHLVSALTCPDSLAEVTAERALLSFLDGSCQTPICASARLTRSTKSVRSDNENRLCLDGMILSLDGRVAHRLQLDAPVDDAVALGETVGAHLLEMAGGRGFLA